MITVSEVQQAAVSAELAKRAKPAVPQPTEAHVDWAKNVLGSSRAPVADRIDALWVMEAAGLDPDPYDASKAADDAPHGARHIRAAMVAREQEEARGAALKAYEAGSAVPGPSKPLDPRRPEAGDFDRGYISAGHGAESPQAEPPRSNPAPVQEPGRVYPVAMPGAPMPVAHVVLPANVMAATVPVHVTAALSMGSPSDR